MPLGLKVTPVSLDVPIFINLASCILDIKILFKQSTNLCNWSTFVFNKFATKLYKVSVINSDETSTVANFSLAAADPSKLLKLIANLSLCKASANSAFNADFSLVSLISKAFNWSLNI